MHVVNTRRALKERPCEASVTGTVTGVFKGSIVSGRALIICLLHIANCFAYALGAATYLCLAYPPVLIKVSVSVGVGVGVGVCE